MRNTVERSQEVRKLRQGLQRGLAPVSKDTLSLGLPAVDDHLGRGIARAAVQEIYAETSAEAQTANGFALGLALRLGFKALIWLVQNGAVFESGRLYGSGLAEWGLDTRRLILVHVKDAAQLLSAGEEALASGAAQAVILSGWGEAAAVNLTSSRRLAFAAARGDSTGFFVRAAARPASSAAETRWSVASVPSSNQDAHYSLGRPAFRASLLRCRTGAPPKSWIMEWDREARSFVEPSTSGGLVPLPGRQSHDLEGSLGERAA